MNLIFPDVEKTTRLLAALKCPYWIAGGWALDMFLNRQTRLHKDIEIAIARADQNHLLPLPGLSSVEYVEDHERKPWHGRKLELPVHELYANFYGGNTVEVLLNEFEGDAWLYRRNKAVVYPRAHFEGLRFLPPEVVLLYKSKNPRPEDEQDFAAVEGRLDPAARKWLADSIARDYPAHPWEAKLKLLTLSEATKGKF